VVWKGGEPVTYGRIEFRSLADPTIQATGELESNGSFTMTTFSEGNSRPGAVAGQYKVIVEPDVDDDQPKALVVISEPYTVEPRENTFKIEIPRSRR
jgi:hypothetical protein